MDTGLAIFESRKFTTASLLGIIVADVSAGYLEQSTVDAFLNGKRLIKENKARLNPKSKHNISQVIVPRFDKNGFPIKGRERVCLNLPPVNKGFEPYKHPIPNINDVTQQLMESSWYTEFDLDQGYEQLKVDVELVDLLTFTCSFGKVSMLVMPYGVIFGSGMFQSRITEEFAEFLHSFLFVYIDNLKVRTKTLGEHVDAVEKVLATCRKANLHPRKEKCCFMINELVRFMLKGGSTPIEKRTFLANKEKRIL